MHGPYFIQAQWNQQSGHSDISKDIFQKFIVRRMNVHISSQNVRAIISTPDGNIVISNILSRINACVNHNYYVLHSTN